MFKIKNSDEFVFDAMVNSVSDEGTKELTVDYKRQYGDSLIVTIEGYGNRNSLVGLKKITYGSFKRRFPKHRVYLQGHVRVG